jgi:hypothetical protein
LRELPLKQLQEARAFDIAATDDQRDLLARHALTLLQQRRQRCRAGTLHGLMRVVEVDANSFRDLIFRDLNDASSTSANHFNRPRVGLASGNAVGEGACRIRLDGFAGDE